MEAYVGFNDGEEQKKVFKDEITCIEWVRKNCDKITSINGYLTYKQILTHFDIIGLIRKENGVRISISLLHRALANR